MAQAPIKKTRVALTPAQVAAKAAAKVTRFKTVGGKRVAKAIKMIGLIGNLSGSGYTYTADQVEKIKTALNDAITKTMAKFAPGQAKAEQKTFDL